MKNMNFIPSYRLAARARRRRTRIWITGGAAYVVALLAVYGCCYGLWGRSPGSLADEQAKANSLIQQRSEAIHGVQRDLAVQDLMLKACRAVENQPDWSILLALLARSMTDEVLLTQCDLHLDRPPSASSPAAAPAAPAAAQAPSQDAAPLLLKIAGYGKTMASVLRFAQELERTDLFDQIRLVKTNSESLLSGSAISFQMECSLGGKGGVSQ